MKIEIRYLSKTGNTKKIAEAIGEELKVEAKPISTSIKKDTDILFLGGAVYAFGIDEELKKFISKLDHVKKVAIFTTSALTKIAYKEMKKCLDDKNIVVCEDNYYCKGKYKFLNKNRPNDTDLLEAKEFAKLVVASNKK